MPSIRTHIYLATKTRWIHLRKTIELPAVPRVGENIKLSNPEVGDYFAFTIIDVTHHENGTIDVMTELFDNVDNRMYSFDEEDEFDEYVQFYTALGWSSPRGIRENTRYRPG